MNLANNNQVKTEVEPVYSPTHDITFLMKHTYKVVDGQTSHAVSTEVVGFYYGEPTKENVKKYGSCGLKATFE